MPMLVPNQSRSLTPEEERRRRMPYSPSADGQSEQRVERAILRANVDGEDPVEAAQTVEPMPDPRAIASMLRAPSTQLRAPMSGPATEPGFQLEAPMTGPPRINADAERAALSLRAPAVASSSRVPTSQFVGQDLGTGNAMQTDRSAQLDERDRQRARRMTAAMGVLGGVGALTSIIGAARGNRNAFEAGRGLMGVGEAIPAQAPIAAIGQRQEQAAAEAAAAQEQADRERTMRFEDEDRLIAADERALDADYRQTLMRSMDVNANRREFEMGRVGQREERNYDPAHPLAESRRSFLLRLIATHPVTQAAFGGLDLSQMGARDLQQLADQVARRLGQVPNRQRGVDDAMLARIVAGLDDAPDQAPTQEAAPVEAEPQTRVQRAARALRGESTTPAPAAVDPAAAARARVFGGDAPTQPTGPAPVEAAPSPQAPRRDRTLAEMAADYGAARRGQPLPSGRSRVDEFSESEWQTLGRAALSRRAGERDVAAALMGTGGRAQEFSVNQPQTQAYTQADVARLTRPYSEASALVRDINAAIAEYDRLAGGRDRDISQAQFEAMRSGGAFSRLMSTERLGSLTSAFTNAQLRAQSGAAVTDSEAARFFRALNMNAMSSPAEFRAAIARARRAALNDLEVLRNSNPGAYDHLRGGAR